MTMILGRFLISKNKCVMMESFEILKNAALKYTIVHESWLQANLSRVKTNVPLPIALKF